MAYTDYLDTVQEIYIGYYERPADPNGLLYWAGRIDAQNGNINAVIEAFANSAESQALHGTIDATTIDTVINDIYQALFNRDADTGGLDYYHNGFVSGQFTAATIMLNILDGAQNEDALSIQNKLAAANQFTTTLDPELDGYNLQATYAGDADAEQGRTYLAGVTWDPNTLPLQTATTTFIREHIADEGDPIAPGGATFTLTNDTDVATANIFNAPQVYTPGGNDRINSLQDEDVLTGEGTNPTLNATLGNANDNGATIITPTFNGIETLNAAFTGSGALAVTSLDLQDETGLNAANITRISQASNFAEIGNVTTVLPNMSIANSNANQAGVVEFSFAAGVLAGENTGALALDNVNVLAVGIGQNTSGIGAFGVGTQGYEALTINSTGAANVIGTMQLPMDTGTAGTVTITGDQDLRLGNFANIVNVGNPALVEVENAFTAGTGITLAGGRIATIDASAFTGDLTLVLDQILDVGKAGTSGVNQDVTVTGGTGDDTFVVFDAIQAGDTINGGDGTDTINFYVGSTIASVAGSIETAAMYANGGAIAADFDNLPDVTGVTVRNIGNVGGFNNPAAAAATFTLTDMTATQATGITAQHSTTGNNEIQNTSIIGAVKTNTASDTLGVTITDGLNTDPRFNFTVVTAIAGNPSTIENITITDSDSESNSVELTSFAQHTGTITLTGGLAGTFINLDVNTAGADVTGVTTGLTVDGGQVQQGLLGIDTDGTAVDYVAGNIVDVGALATEVRLGAATINAANEASGVIVRVGTNAASAVGAQSITTGSGDDTVIFDNLSDARAGLTISDTVAAGTGTDQLVIDGNGVIISLGASEWTNVSGFESVRLVGNGAAALSTMIGQNSYNLALTDALITANGAGMLIINNDNDISNDAASALNATTGANTAGTGVESAVTIDARTLSATSHFTYNGEEGGWNDVGLVAGMYDAADVFLAGTVDKFILADANINGANVIDGGAVDNLGTTFAANGDILEVRNTATVTAGDLANIRNVGIIAGSNDQAVAQALNLELNDTVVDALVDSYHTSTATQIETLTIRMNQATEVGATAGMGLNLDASTLTTRSAVNVTLDNVVGAVDTVKIGFGLSTTANFTTAVDEIVIDVSTFGLTLDADDIGLAIGTNAGGDGTNIETGVAAATAAATRLIIDDTGANLDIFYDADGNGAQAQVLVASFTGLAAYAAGDFTLVA